ncbi:two-component system CheB/CheR fusion protein [Mucilaginibacter frigoritolerans]|uniref:histidine kinase n=1 Tax=Mucilaginibacter frigoritolerans TaxID=652788 RepID=A0A562TR46_9SPHI|nr:chemotaxis protein CheB [Mucilaginibacter frigoritolerans]TWI95526.1 two-component system CheB/CheR fusion protein [Mucilaginibacter frigoritolerans]
MHPKPPHYIIAIGASAGGMEEINSFFDHTPLDGVSYIIIQHLSSDFKSRMVELLARHSKLAVVEATEGLTIASNVVYLIPHNKYMTVLGGRLFLTAKDQEKTPHLTINHFLLSLAADFGEKTIAIILSGLGSDGTEGIKAIKKVGGMVIARNPENSDFSSMPSHAIATGLVDFVLEPELMPNAIEDYVQYGISLVSDNKDDEKNLGAILNLIKDKLPLDFSEYKQTTILRRTLRRAAQNNFSSLGKYLLFLKETPSEIEALAKDFLISVTAFFRDAPAFDFIETNVFPKILKRLAPGEELKIWVAGCATGEEVYSIAIIIAELLTGDYKDTVVKIFATDIDTAALAHAGKGLYPAGITKNISAHRLESFFLKEGESYRVKPLIRKMVIFAHHDLVKNPPYCNMQFISCRNLLIYMTPVLQKKIFAMLLFGLKMDGYLFLGSSENPMPIIQNLEVVNKKWKIYRNLEAKRVVSFDAFSFPDQLEVKRNPSGFTSDNNIVLPVNPTLAEAMHESLAQEMDYLTICIDENNQVIKSYGDTAKYLLPKHFNSNLTALLPKPLDMAFNTLSKKALKTNERVSTSGIKIKYDGKVIKVKLSVNPLSLKPGGPRWLIVTFKKDNFIGTAEAGDLIFDEKINLDQYTLNLEEEVKDLKVSLHSSREQLNASNENMQSFNEELLSANEEMQSTNEEMQSVNEELDTINSDYQSKNKELLELNDDLNNYFRSNINGQFINNSLLLMKFSPGTVNQINLLESDIGRPLSNISTNIKLETIIEDVKQVLTDGSIITKEIETNNGKWYQVMTMPYVQQSDNKNNGAVITFNDVTALKRAQLELDQKNISLLRINADLDNFIHAASHDLLAPLSNIETSINIMNKIALSDAKLHDFLLIINESVKKFRELITDIATIAKVEGEMSTQDTVDLDEIINNIEWSLEDKIKESGAIIKRNLEITEIMFSKKNLRSIVYNLISNAIKFKRDESPVIHITTVKNGDYLVLTVEDNGKGIRKGGIEKIFEMYGRLSHDVEGQGIGLYLAKKIVNAAGGSITVESELGIGTTFIINLKMVAQESSITPIFN